MKTAPGLSVVLVGVLGAMAFAVRAHSDLLSSQAGKGRAPNRPAPSSPASDQLKTEIDLSTKEIGSGETALGDLVADAIRVGASADASFIDASAFEENVTIPKGAFKAEDVVKALSYKSDSIFTMKLTGDQIRGAFEHGLFLYPKFNPAFVQFSGITTTMNADAEADHRVMAIKVGSEAIETGKIYRVAMRAPLANGALAYSKIWKNSEKQDTSMTLEAAINGYLNTHRSITKGDERLVTRSK